jgi:hypothetical protein
MITIFCDFCPFSAKIDAFSKSTVTINFLQKLAAVWANNANIFAIFGRNIKKIIISVPGGQFLQQPMGKGCPLGAKL